MRLILINSSISVVLCLLAMSCQNADNSSKTEHQKIWSDQILAVEFIHTDTILFYKDTLKPSVPKSIIFVASNDFKDSKILNFRESLKDWLHPLQYSRDLYSLYFEMAVVSEQWIKVKNGTLNRDEFLWIPRNELSKYKTITWSDFLMGQDMLIPVEGDLGEILKYSPTDDSDKMNLIAFDCISVERIVDGNWVKVGVKSFCGNESFDQTGFLKWKDEDDNLLIKFE